MLCEPLRGGCWDLPDFEPITLVSSVFEPLSSIYARMLDGRGAHHPSLVIQSLEGIRERMTESNRHFMDQNRDDLAHLVAGSWRIYDEAFDLVRKTKRITIGIFLGMHIARHTLPSCYHTSIIACQSILVEVLPHNFWSYILKFRKQRSCSSASCLSDTHSCAFFHQVTHMPTCNSRRAALTATHEVLH